MVSSFRWLMRGSRYALADFMVDESLGQAFGAIECSWVRGQYIPLNIRRKSLDVPLYLLTLQGNHLGTRCCQFAKPISVDYYV